MKVFEATLKDGRVYRVLCENENQVQRFLSAAVKISILKAEDILNGIHSISDWEKLVDVKKYARKCDECGCGMNEGYYVEGSYYCSENCRSKHLSDEEFISMHNEGLDAYYTEWEDEEDYQYQVKNGELIEL